MLRKILAFLGLARDTRNKNPSSSGKSNASGPVISGAHPATHNPAATPVLAAPGSAQIASMSVVLPPDRSRPGTLLALMVDGTLLSGPWPAIGRADERFAATQGNPSRIRTLPFGDVPTGAYELSGKPPTPAGSEAAFGRFGALSFSPLDGEAAAAEAVGRTGLLLHGGRNWQASTDGSLRVPDLAMEEMLSMLPADPVAMRPRVWLSIRDAEDCDGWKADPSKGSRMRRIWARQFLPDRSESSDDGSSDGMIGDDPVEDTFPSLFQLLYMQMILDETDRDHGGKHRPPADPAPDVQIQEFPTTHPSADGASSASDGQGTPYAPSGGAYDR